MPPQRASTRILPLCEASDEPSRIVARSASFSAVSGRALMNGCTKVGKRSFEKITPEKIHLGIITRFIRPLALSIFCARLAVSKPSPPNEIAPIVPITKMENSDPSTRMWKTSTPKPSSSVTSMSISTSRLLSRASKKSLRRMGVATNLLSSLRWRISTRANPMPHMAAFIKFIPSKPGIRKSMFREPGSLELVAEVGSGSLRPAELCKASSTTARARTLSGRAGSNRYL